MSCKVAYEASFLSPLRRTPFCLLHLVTSRAWTIILKKTITLSAACATLSTQCLSLRGLWKSQHYCTLIQEKLAVSHYYYIEQVLSHAEGPRIFPGSHVKSLKEHVLRLSPFNCTCGDARPFVSNLHPSLERNTASTIMSSFTSSPLMAAVPEEGGAAASETFRGPSRLKRSTSLPLMRTCRYDLLSSACRMLGVKQDFQTAWKS